MASGQFPRQSSISITWRGKSSRHRSSLWRYVDFPVWLKAGIGQARWPHTSDAYNAWTRRSWTLSCSRVRSWIIMRRAITHYAPPPHPTTRNALLYEWVRQYAGELDYGCIRGNALSFRITFACRTFTLFLYSLLSLLRSALTEIKRSTWPWDSFATNIPLSYRFGCVCSVSYQLFPGYFVSRIRIVSHGLFTPSFLSSFFSHLFRTHLHYAILRGIK